MNTKKVRTTSENVGYYSAVKYSSIQRLNGFNKMHGVKRVITFCILIVILPATLIIIPLYLRHSVFAEVKYELAESDIIEIRDGISSIFCQKHSLRMNTSFNAFQLRNKPEISKNRKHIRLKKSMTLPDDTLEYWGFYLLKGATVKLKVCSRYEGSRILVVKGDRNLRTCGLLEHNKNKVGAHFAEGHEKVQVTFETVAEVVLSEENHSHHEERSFHHKLKQHQMKVTKSDLSLNQGEELNHGGEDFSEDKVNANIKLSKLGRLPNNNNNDDNESNNNIANLNKTVLSRLNLNKLHETDTNRNTIIKENNDSHLNHNNNNTDPNEYPNYKTPQKLRHRRHYERMHRNIDKHNRNRSKRDAVYDRKIYHGGNALNFTENESNSISSFENSLYTCYNGQILLAQGFPPSSQCLSVKFLETARYMITEHEVDDDGYYYYIFYSDNDIVRNDIHAVFDIYKPTFQYSTQNSTEQNKDGNSINGCCCVNEFNCTFAIQFLSNEIVIVEVPTKDGIEHDDANDISYLISTCHPRMSIYIIFPISVLFLILSCAFL